MANSVIDCSRPADARRRHKVNERIQCMAVPFLLSATMGPLSDDGRDDDDRDELAAHFRHPVSQSVSRLRSTPLDSSMLPTDEHEQSLTGGWVFAPIARS